MAGNFATDPLLMLVPWSRRRKRLRTTPDFEPSSTLCPAGYIAQSLADCLLHLLLHPMIDWPVVKKQNKIDTSNN
ncbi:hypothetical protein TKK_0018925 [Trichogramma kaykai]